VGRVVGAKCWGKPKPPPPPPPPPPAPSVWLTADPPEIYLVESSTLTWGSENAEWVVGSNFGAEGVAGSTVVWPEDTTWYWITVGGAGGEATAEVFVYRLWRWVAHVQSRYPTAAVNVHQGDGLAWQDVLKVLVQDGACAFIQLWFNRYSDYLNPRGMVFELAEGALVDGIAFRVRRCRGWPGECCDYHVRMFYMAGVMGPEHAVPGDWPWVLTDFVYGGPTDTWGRWWEWWEINSTNWGLALSCQQYPAFSQTMPYVDVVEATVWYRVYE
jgi:hypothetical protein